MVKMTKAQVKKRLMEAANKLNLVCGSHFIMYDMSATDATKIRDCRDQLVKIVRKLK